MDLIVTHSNADFDALASLLAAKKLYPEAKIVLPSSQERQVREFLNLWIDSIDVVPEKEVSFRDVKRLIIVETRLANRLGRAGGLIAAGGIEIHIYDHHPRTKDDIKAHKDVFAKFGASVTILLDLIRKKNIKLTPIEATIMAMGIYEDTGNLTFRTTTKDDIDSVCFLVASGANLNITGYYLREELTLSEIMLLANLLRSTEEVLINGVSVTFLTSQTKDYVGDFSLLVHRFMDITNVPVVFALNLMDTKVQIVARSHIPNVNVANILSFLGGGGHPTAASAVTRGVSIDKVKRRITNLLRSHIKITKCARDIVDNKFKLINGCVSFKTAKNICCRYKVPSLIVIDEDTVLGILSQANILAHKSPNSKVRGFHFGKIGIVGANLTIYEMKKALLDAKAHALIVKEKAHILGFILRRALLDAFFNEVSRGLCVDIRKPPVIFGQSTNICDKLKNNIPERIFRILKVIGNLADRKNSQIFIVGGFVRDLLMGVKNFDVDIVVETNAIEFAKGLAGIMGGGLVVHRKFGTASVVLDWPRDLPRVGVWLSDKFKIDIATARTEIYEHPAALPTVSFSSIKEDLYRRDFTINALAVSLNKATFGVLLDFFAGQDDIRAKKIRVLHDQSFIDDPTRIFRAVRFEQRFDFTIDEYTQDLIKHAISLEIFERTQKQRLRDEIFLILSEPKPIKGILRMNQLHELRFIHPKLKFNKTILNLLESAEETTCWFKLSFIKKRDLETWLIYFMALIDRLGLNDIRSICSKFVFKKSDEIRILAYKKNCSGMLRFLDSPKKLKPSRIYNLLEPIPYEVILLIMANSKSDRVKKRISTFLTKYNGIKLSISGEDIKKFGLKPGPRYSKILAGVLNAKVDGLLKNKRDELTFAKRLMQ